MLQFTPTGTGLTTADVEDTLERNGILLECRKCGMERKSHTAQAGCQCPDLGPDDCPGKHMFLSSARMIAAELNGIMLQQQFREQNITLPLSTTYTLQKLFEQEGPRIAAYLEDLVALPVLECE